MRENRLYKKERAKYAKIMATFKQDYSEVILKYIGRSSWDLDKPV